MTNPVQKELEFKILNTGDLPTIPVIATKVMQLIEKESATAEELSKIIEADPAIAARVLKISNSSFYGHQRKIQTVSHAIVILGFATLKSLVVAAAVKQVYQPYGQLEKQLLEHSFNVAAISRMIALECAVNAEEAFLGGLFHDIGKIILNNVDQYKFKRCMELIKSDSLSALEAETQIFEYEHTQAGALILKRWNFPESLRTVASKHHSFDFTDEDEFDVKLTYIVGLANMLCHITLDGFAVDSLVEPAMVLNLTETQLSELAEKAKIICSENSNMFS